MTLSYMSDSEIVATLVCWKLCYLLPREKCPGKCSPESGTSIEASFNAADASVANKWQQNRAVGNATLK